jgi:predicted nucleotide-binding protein
MLNKQQMLKALDGLLDEADRLYKVFHVNFATWTPEFAVWLKAAESMIEAIFGTNSQAFVSFRSIYFLPPPGEEYANEFEEQKAKVTWFDSGLYNAQIDLIAYRYSVDRLAPEEPARPTPFIFIAHGGPTLMHVYLVRDFLQALGLIGVVVLDMPNLNLSTNEKVRFYMAICTGGIALATLEDETTTDEGRARPNVEHEIGMMQAAPNIGERIIYLKEDGVQLASNYKEKMWIPFSKDRVQDAFIAIVKELRAFGFLG